MAFEKQASFCRGRNALVGEVRASTIGPKHKQVRLLLSADIYAKALKKGERVDLHVGTGADAGWIMLKDGTQLKPFKSSSKSASLTLILSGLSVASDSATVICEHRIEGDELYIRIPFLKQALSLAEAS